MQVSEKKYNALNLSDSDRIRFSSKLKHIASSLLEKNLSSLPPGLFYGKMGVVLFLFHYSKFSSISLYAEKALEVLEGIFTQVQEEEMDCSFSYGLSGLGWAIEHISQNGFVELDADGLLEEFDERILKEVSRIDSEQRVDLNTGLTGLLAYLLSRQRISSLGKGIHSTVEHLDRMGLRNPEGDEIKWKYTAFNQEAGKEISIVNISLSKGFSGVLNMLSKLDPEKIPVEKVKELSAGACKYILNQKLEPGKYVSVFPVYSKEPGQWVSASLLGWCSGDLGIAMSLYLYGRRTGNEQVCNQAIEVFLHASKRRVHGETQVEDACLCHGTAGIAHIYNKMYGFTGNPEFSECALFWYEETLRMGNDAEGLAGYKYWVHEKHGGSLSEPGLLGGIAGIGLGLISLLAESELHWDECLLLS